MEKTEDHRAEELIFMMKKIGLDLASQVEMNLKCGGISGIQVYFMVYILRHHPEGTYLTELCREIGVSKATVSALLKRLREKGYVFFREDPEDIRRKRVIPTARLLAEGEVFLAEADRLERRICGALDKSEQEEFRRLERKVLEHLDRMEHSDREKEVTLQ